VTEVKTIATGQLSGLFYLLPQRETAKEIAGLSMGTLWRSMLRPRRELSLRII
jgi:hypothetical protein